METAAGVSGAVSAPEVLLLTHAADLARFATPQDTPHCFVDTRGIYRTGELATGSGVVFKPPRGGRSPWAFRTDQWTS